MLIELAAWRDRPERRAVVVCPAPSFRLTRTSRGADDRAQTSITYVVPRCSDIGADRSEIPARAGLFNARQILRRQLRFQLGAQSFGA